MGRTNDITGAEGKAGRSARGFARAGALIGQQMRTAAARRGFAQARLQALWPEIAGPEIAAMASPVRLAAVRGPAGGLLTLAVDGAHAPELQMLLPLLRDRVNAALGPGCVGRIQMIQARPAPCETASAQPPRASRPVLVLGRLAPGISSIGDEDLRRALETLARNVLSKSPTHQ